MNEPKPATPLPWGQYPEYHTDDFKERDYMYGLHAANELPGLKERIKELERENNELFIDHQAIHDHRRQFIDRCIELSSERDKLRVILNGIEASCLKQDRTSGWFNFAQSILIMAQQDLSPQSEETFIGIDWACSKCEGKGWYSEQTPADYEGVYQCSCPDGKRALLDGSLSKAVDVALGKHKTEDPERDKKA